MRVRDVMTVRVRCVTPDTPIHDVVETLLVGGISGVPVLEDDGRIAGIVSESDLLPVKEGAPGRQVRVAADVMRRPVVTVTDDVSVTEAARVLERHRIKRVPVLRDGALVGIVTRSDLLRPYLRSDMEIRAEVEESLGDALSREARSIRIDVDRGVVTLEGPVAGDRERILALRLARAADGVVDVTDALRIEPVPSGNRSGGA